ncbi:MAG: sigma 54 modulation/S30EA ribosomal C-terminal domain-containing protein, partial [Pseudomonadota bacterium]
KDRHHRVKISEIDIKRATKYIISAEDEQSDETGPLIIAEKEISVPKITVSEAVMKMELENLPALMFKNSKTDRTNVVYLRNDGNISWVDSQ